MHDTSRNWGTSVSIVTRLRTGQQW